MRNFRLKCKIISADPEASIKEANQFSVTIYEYEFIDPITIRCYLYGSRIQDYILALQGRGAEVHILSNSKNDLISFLKRRFLLILELVLLIMISMWLPGRVLFISVEGNKAVSTNEIIHVAEAYGLRFGTERVSISSEQFKNYLLEHIPQLSWAAVNTAGCCAVISVKEEDAIEDEGEDIPYSNIVASNDGVIVSATITSGTQMVSVGEAVKEGQLLVSGTSNEGEIFSQTRAAGEIYALTSRSVTGTLSNQILKKDKVISTNTEYSVIVGKKRIILSKDSRNLPAGCDRIYKEWYMVLPGGYTLPFAFCSEQVVYYNTKEATLDAEQMENVLNDQVDAYVLQQMNSGRIIQRSAVFSPNEDAAVLNGQYYSLEMIGRESSKELNFNDVKVD